jgi:4-carboxymuconolactone decarboxylase
MMIRLAAALVLLTLVPWTSAEAQGIVITHGGSHPVRQGPAENFTGNARIETLFEARDPSHASGGSVTFEAGARTAWHSHPRGQVLIITAGVGRVQRWGAPFEEVRAGDVVRIPAGEKHWHGASPQASMTHIAISEHLDGTVVNWMEHVSDPQYEATPQTQGPLPSAPSGPRQQRFAPGLARLTDDVLYGDVWRRAELSPRDRGLVTVATLIATGKTAQLPGHLGRTLDAGVTPREASGLLAHLAIYAGWPNAVSALEVYEQVYTARKVDLTTLQTAGQPLPAAQSDAAHSKALTVQLATVAPKFAELTNNVVFDDLWRRSDLTPRDRSLATIAAVTAMGDDDQLDLYLRRGIESGLTRDQIAEAVTHVGFYAGWPKATKALGAIVRILGPAAEEGR